MPTIHRPGFSPAPVTTGATAQTTATTATTATGQAIPQTAPLPRVSAADLKPMPVAINGFGGKPLPNVNITLVPQPGQMGTGEAKADIDDGGWVSRGYIDVGFKPALGGVDVEVTSRHTKPSGTSGAKGDDMVVYLQARVLDGGKERIITLATLFDGVMNADGGSTARKNFHVDYDAINAYLKAKAPGLKFVPGDPLAAYAVWKTAGHQWGGFMREGYFNSPAPLGRATAIDARVGKLGENPALVSSSDVQKPIDITHKVPEALVTQFPLVLEKGAKFVSRREHETKFCPRSMGELKTVTLKLMDIAASSAKEQEQSLLDMFGKDEALSKARGFPVSGWKISTTDRYYARDDAGKIRKGADGLPVVVPMFDVYQDDPNSAGSSWNSTGKFPFAQNNMAVRFRDGEIKAGSNVGSMGKLNMKTPRVSDPFSLIQTGLELSLDTKPGITKSEAAMQQLSEYLDKAPAPYNPMIEQKKVSYGLKGANALGTAVDNLANRYKFTLEHENGMEIEISMDFVHAGFVFQTKTVDVTRAFSDAQKFDHYARLLETPDATTQCISGELKSKQGEINTVVFTDPRGDLVMANFWLDEQGHKKASEHPAVRFPQVEMEMDHVQARSSGPVQSAYVSPTEVKNLTTDAEQETFLKTVTTQATMNGPPTTHNWEDLKDIKLYDDHNYQELSAAVSAFRTHLFPGGVDAARQKAAQALELGGHIGKKKIALGASMPSATGRDVSVSTDYQDRTKITVKAGYGYGSSSKGTLGGKPAVVTIDWDGFPIKIPLSGSETTKQVAQEIQRVLDKAVLHRATLTESNGAFTIAITDR